MTFPKCAGLGYLKFLKRVHATLDPKWYLEIGTSRGDSLALSKARSIAIDPKFRLKHDVFTGKDELRMFQMPSDTYFQDNGEHRNHPKIDLAFLDGMHLFEFLLRDFMGTEKVARKNGTIILHDCVPMSYAAADRNWDRKVTKQWTGDVWKVVPILREYRPDLTVRVIDCPPSGMCVITGLDPKSTVLTDHYDEILAKYSDMDIDDFGLDKLHETLDLVGSDSAAAAPFNGPD